MDPRTSQLGFLVVIDSTIRPTVAASASLHSNICTPLDRFPSGFEATAKANGKGFVSPMKNERMLLNTLLGTCLHTFHSLLLTWAPVAIHKSDPDIIVGHDFLAAWCDSASYAWS